MWRQVVRSWLMLGFFMMMVHTVPAGKAQAIFFFLCTHVAEKRCSDCPSSGGNCSDSGTAPPSAPAPSMPETLFCFWDAGCMILHVAWFWCDIASRQWLAHAGST